MPPFKDDHQSYSSSLKPLANDLRHNLTKAEACLWKYLLSAGQLSGYTFRRQRPVLNYIADFMSKELMLIIEVDGSVHNEMEVSRNDLIRQTALEGEGFTVLRFSNEVVLHRMEDVRRKLIQWIEDYEDRTGKRKEDRSVARVRK